MSPAHALPVQPFKRVGVAILNPSIRLPSSMPAVAGLLLAVLSAFPVPASAQVQCDCGNYRMSCMAGCLGNLYCNNRCQQFHDTCVSSCSGTYSGGDRHHRHDDDDDRYPHHRHW